MRFNKFKRTTLVDQIDQNQLSNSIAFVYSNIQPNSVCDAYLFI